MKCDTQTLAVIVDKCQNLSTDLRLSPDARRLFLTFGTSLRDLMVRLVATEIKNGSEQLKQANQSLQQLNQQLSDGKSAIENAATTLANVEKLVGVLDSLLKTSVSLV